MNRSTIDLWVGIFVALGLGAIVTLIASVLPAWKASRMVIVDALRSQR